MIFLLDLYGKLKGMQWKALIRCLTDRDTEKLFYISVNYLVLCHTNTHTHTHEKEEQELEAQQLSSGAVLCHWQRHV